MLCFNSEYSLKYFSLEYRLLYIMSCGDRIGKNNGLMIGNKVF